MRTKKLKQLTIIINGTDTNPWHDLGLTQNPFPKLAKAKWTAGEITLNSLAGEPVKDAADIRARLQGTISEELIELCISQFEPGVTVTFQIEFD